MKFRSAALDDLHLTALMCLDDAGRPWARGLRRTANALYRAHRRMLIWLIDLAALVAGGR